MLARRAKRLPKSFPIRCSDPRGSACRHARRVPFGVGPPPRLADRVGRRPPSLSVQAKHPLHVLQMARRELRPIVLDQFDVVLQQLPGRSPLFRSISVGAGVRPGPTTGPRGGAAIGRRDRSGPGPPLGEGSRVSRARPTTGRYKISVGANVRGSSSERSDCCRPSGNAAVARVRVNRAHGNERSLSVFRLQGWEQAGGQSRPWVDNGETIRPCGCSPNRTGGGMRLDGDG